MVGSASPYSAFSSRMKEMRVSWHAGSNDERADLGYERAMAC